MNLIFDIGNSRIKIAVYNNHRCIDLWIVKHFEEVFFSEILVRYPAIRKSIVSSVRQIPNNFLRELSENVAFVHVLSSQSKLPIGIAYQTPETLGADRVAAVVGACNLSPETNLLVVDSGTAITFDFVEAGRVYLGGNISLGLNMRFNALNHFTSKLPLLNPTDDWSLIGSSTNEAIINGVQNSLLFEFEGYYREAAQRWNQCFKVFLTGGDAFFFERIEKRNIFAEPKLNLIGLNNILEYNYIS